MDLPKNLAKPAQRALAAANVKTLSDLSKFTQEQVAHLHGIGPNALRQLKEAMAASGLSFAKPKQ